MKKISLVILLSVAIWFVLYCELSFGSSGSSSGSSGSGNSGSSSGPSGSNNSGSNSGSSGGSKSGSSSGSSGSGHSGSSSGSSSNSGSSNNDTSTTTTTAGTTGLGETSTSTINLTGSGTITAYTPGLDYIMFGREGSTTPVKHYYTKSTVLVDPEGHTVEWTALRSGMPVTYTYVQEADRMVVTKVTLAARLSVVKKETETAPTTTKP